MKKLALRAFSLLLVLCLLATTLVGCDDYKPRKSSDEEATPVFVLGEDTVNFEALYTFFLNRCENTEGYSDTYFTGPEANARFDAILAEAIRELSEIYALFAVCREVNIDPYSEEVEDLITEQIKLSVEGGSIGDFNFTGFESYDAYLDYLKKNYHMNDAVNRLMLRYAVCEELLMDYYAETYTYTKEDVRAFFESDDCIHIMWVGRSSTDGGLAGMGYTDAEIKEFNIEQVEKARDFFLAGLNGKAIEYTTLTSTELYLGRHTLDSAYYAELIEAVYALDTNGVTDVIDLGVTGLFVVKRLPKSEADFNNTGFYAAITDAYLYDLQMSAVLTKAASLMQGIVYKEAYSSLTVADFIK